MKGMSEEVRYQGYGRIKVLYHRECGGGGGLKASHRGCQRRYGTLGSTVTV